MLDDISGLRPYSTTANYSIWQLITPPSRVTVVEPNGTVVAIGSNPIGVTGAAVPAAGGTVMLSEPTGGWSASVNGRSLTPIASPAGSWAQAFKLPPGGGQLSIGHTGFVHDVWIVIEALALLAVMGLALPGIHVADEAQREAAAEIPSGRLATDTAGARGPAGDLAAAGARSGSMAAGARPAESRAAGSRTAAAAAAARRWCRGGGQPVRRWTGRCGRGAPGRTGRCRRCGGGPGRAQRRQDGAGESRVARSLAAAGQAAAGQVQAGQSGRSGGEAPRNRDRDRDTDRTARYELDRDLVDTGRDNAGLDNTALDNTALDSSGWIAQGWTAPGWLGPDWSAGTGLIATSATPAPGRSAGNPRLAAGPEIGPLAAAGAIGLLAARLQIWTGPPVTRHHWDRADSDPAGWPAAASASGDRLRSEEPGGRHSAARPQTGPRSVDRATSQNSGPQSRAWPYTDDPSAGVGESRDYRDYGSAPAQPSRDDVARPRPQVFASGLADSGQSAGGQVAVRASRRRLSGPASPPMRWMSGATPEATGPVMAGLSTASPTTASPATTVPPLAGADTTETERAAAVGTTAVRRPTRMSATVGTVPTWDAA